MHTTMSFLSICIPCLLHVTKSRGYDTNKYEKARFVHIIMTSIYFFFCWKKMLACKNIIVIQVGINFLLLVDDLWSRHQIAHRNPHSIPSNFLGNDEYPIWWIHGITLLREAYYITHHTTMSRTSDAHDKRDW